MMTCPMPSLYRRSRRRRAVRSDWTEFGEANWLNRARAALQCGVQGLGSEESRIRDPHPANTKLAVHTLPQAHSRRPAVGGPLVVASLRLTLERQTFLDPLTRPAYHGSSPFLCAKALPCSRRRIAVGDRHMLPADIEAVSTW